MDKHNENELRRNSIMKSMSNPELANYATKATQGKQNYEAKDEQ
jgi:hypothetical protein